MAGALSHADMPFSAARIVVDDWQGMSNTQVARHPARQGERSPNASLYRIFRIFFLRLPAAYQRLLTACSESSRHMESLIRLLVVTLAVLTLNIPFGYWRESVRKFSFAWVLAIHLPVPLVVLMRIYGGIGFAFHTYLLLITAFFIGQYVGVRLHRRMARTLGAPLSSCMVMDVWRRTSSAGGSGKPRG